MQALGAGDRLDRVADPVLEGAEEDHPQRNDQQRGEVEQGQGAHPVSGERPRRAHDGSSSARSRVSANRTATAIASSSTETAAAAVVLSCSIRAKM